MDEVDNKDITTYLNEVMKLMLDNPGYPSDTPLFNKLKTIGIEPGGEFKLDQFNAQTQEMIKKVPAIVEGLFSKMTANPPSENLQNGWNVITSGLGEYGTAYF